MTNCISHCVRAHPGRTAKGQLLEPEVINEIENQAKALERFSFACRWEEFRPRPRKEPRIQDFCASGLSTCTC